MLDDIDLDRVRCLRHRRPRVQSASRKGVDRGHRGPRPQSPFSSRHRAYRQASCEACGGRLEVKLYKPRIFRDILPSAPGPDYPGFALK
jgi:hypothetical protein